MASGYEKAECGVDPNLGWNGGAAIRTPVVVAADAAIFLLGVTLAAAPWVSVAVWAWELFNG